MSKTTEDLIVGFVGNNPESTEGDIAAYLITLRTESGGDITQSFYNNFKSSFDSLVDSKDLEVAEAKGGMPSMDFYILSTRGDSRYTTLSSIYKDR